MSEKEAKAEAKAAKAKAKAMRPWFKKKRFWALGIIVLIIAVQALSSGGSDTTSTSTNTSTEATTEDTSATENEDSGGTIAQINAKRAAKNYIDSMGFSRKGLIKQLEFEGYSNADAVYGTDALKADWNEQAVRVGKQYLDSMAFSRSGLIKQLEFDGFTRAEAEFGAKGNGL